MIHITAKQIHDIGNRFQWIYSGLAVLLCMLPALSIQAAERIRSDLTLDEIPFNGQRAYEYLKQICDIGPRPSGSQGMVQQQEMLKKHFTALGGSVVEQRFQTQHPLTGAPCGLANLIVTWHPDKKERILLATHYDTRPLPDEDPNPDRRQHGRFIGANDGASGVAIFMEMAHSMPKHSGRYGIDFVMLDGEEFIFGSSSRSQERGRYFLGSEWFAKEYVKNPPSHTYRWGVLLDMIGDSDLQIYKERNSIRWKETRPLVEEIWATAAKLGVKEFIHEAGYNVLDDHIRLRNVGKIPTCNIIDFDFPVSPNNRNWPNNHYWHTEADTPARCSALSLAKVGWVIQEWMKNTK
ncbi:MAG: M28 family peptidase [Pirellulales bacterium]|nr:M28 family peptidase [Pirellulales bacterium]